MVCPLIPITVTSHGLGSPLIKWGIELEWSQNSSPALNSVINYLTIPCCEKGPKDQRFNSRKRLWLHKETWALTYTFLCAPRALRARFLWDVSHCACWMAVSVPLNFPKCLCSCRAGICPSQCQMTFVKVLLPHQTMTALMAGTLSYLSPCPSSCHGVVSRCQ
jgi:hypothetical protein